MDGATAARHGGWCGSCGSRLVDPEAPTCPRCEAVLEPASAPRRKGRIAAALLAFFFGGLGAHRFYLGQPGLGLVYLFLSWTMIPGVAALVDFVRLLAMSDEAFASTHGRRRGGGAAVAAGAIAAGLVAWGLLVAISLPALRAYAEALAAAR